MPFYELEFWFSASGVPNSFYLLGRLPEGTTPDGSPAGLPATISHGPLLPGARFFYRVRRIFHGDAGEPPVASEFSAVQEAVAPFPSRLRGRDMDVFFGSDTILGIGPQAQLDPHDKPRKVAWIVESTGGRVRPEMQTVASRALRRTTARRVKTGVGRATFPFNIPFEATPNGTLTQALRGLFGPPTTTRVGGTAVALSADAAANATTLAVDALPAALPSAALLNFPVARSVVLTAPAAANATTLAVAALPAAVPSGTPLESGGIWIRTTASASSGATSLTVSALPFALADGATINWTQNRYVTTSAPAAEGATSVAVAALGAALTDGDTAYYGAKYRHVWKNQKRYGVSTLAQLISDFVEVSPGAFINQMEWGTDFDQDTFITPTIQGNALNNTRRYTMAQTGLDVALTDNLNAFSMIDAQVVIGGAISEDVKSVNVTINRNARAKGTLRRKRGVARHSPTVTDVGMTLSLYHTSEDFIAKYMGHAETPTEEYGATCRIVYLPISLEYATCPIIEGDLPYEWGVQIPRAALEADNPDVRGPEEIMEEITVAPNWDAAEGTDAIFYVVNDETLADIMTPLAPITPVPANHVSTYVAA